MRFVGIDLGRRTTGIATSEGQLAQPYTTITHKSTREAQDKVIKLLASLSAQEVVIGYVQGKTEKFFENFARQLREKMPGIRIVMRDESLSTRQARETMIKLQVPRMKKKEKEHQIAASLILQSYLDSQND